MSERIGFIGLGIMGSGMARNLLARATPSACGTAPGAPGPHPRSRGHRGRWPGRPGGAQRPGDDLRLRHPRRGASGAGPDGVLESLSPGSLVVDHLLHQPARHSPTGRGGAGGGGARWLDAPVSGGSEGAAGAH